MGLSQSNTQFVLSLQAGEDIHAYPYRFCKTPDAIVHAAVLGEAVLGITTKQATDVTASGMAVDVVVPGGGTCKLEVAEAVSAGDPLIANVTTGKGINTGLIAGMHIGAIALEDASGDGSIIEVLPVYDTYYTP